MARAKAVKEEEKLELSQEKNIEIKDIGEEAVSNEAAENSKEESGHIEIVLLGNIRHNGEKYKKGDSPVLPDETVQFLIKKGVAKKTGE